MAECSKPARGLGMCAAHYYHHLKGLPDRPRCSIEDCDRPIQAKGICGPHYQAARLADMSRPRCRLSDCSRAVHSQGLCYQHDQTCRRHGLTPQQYESLIVTAGGVCAICGQVPECGLFVDHDHTTGEVRALICSPCNLVIGHAQENPDTLLAAATYLLQFSDVLQQAP